MYGFVVVLIFIFFGFALIFLELSEAKTAYGDHLYGTFKILFGEPEDSDYSVSQKLFTSLIVFLLNVVLLNLLISIMGDSYDKVQEKRVLTDSLTRLDMSLEAMVFLRVIRRGKKTEGKGYLIYCETEEADNENDPENVEWEGRINVIKKTFKQTDQKVQSLTDKIDATNSTIVQKIGGMEKEMGVMKQSMEQKIGAMEQKMEHGADGSKYEHESEYGTEDRSDGAEDGSKWNTNQIWERMEQKMEASMNTMNQNLLEILKNFKA